MGHGNSSREFKPDHAAVGTGYRKLLAGWPLVATVEAHAPRSLLQLGSTSTGAIARRRERRPRQSTIILDDRNFYRLKRDYAKTPDGVVVGEKEPKEPENYACRIVANKT